MVIIMKKDTPPPALQQLAVTLQQKGVRAARTDTNEHLLLTLVGDTWQLDTASLQALPFVEDVKRLTPPYHLAGRACHSADTVVSVGEARIGQDFCLIAGPCAVESAPQMDVVSRAVKAGGAQLLRGGLFKPRTSPYAFQGYGEAGLPLLLEARRQTGLPVVTEITDAAQLHLFEDVDVIQVGARNMQNYALLQALASFGKPVLLKRSLSATVDELLQSAEYLLHGGNTQVILCERGVRTFSQETRATLDLCAVPVLKKVTHLPVIVDPSHATGYAHLVKPMALAAAVAGADGLMIEVHNDPPHALSDGAQSLTPDAFDDVAKCVFAVRPYACR